MPDARPSPPRDETLAFGDFLLDLAGERLWRADEAVFLRPKTWSVLRVLVEGAGRLITYRQLLDTVWPGTAITPNVLTNVIGELRTALGDRGQPSRYVQTVHRRGYRFVAEVRKAELRSADDRGAPAPVGERMQRPPVFVGREAELEELHDRWQRVAAGERQIVFVAGEAGIGKSCLVDAFVASLLAPRAVGGAAGAPVLARAQCIERQGAREPYLPLLDALEQVAAGTGRKRLVASLRRSAPTWIAHMPWLASPTELQALWKSLPGSGEGRMAREGSRLLEALTKERPLVLILEDLHWSDPPTLDVLTALATRPGPAHLLVIGTYRPVDALVEGHPIVPVARTLRQNERVVEVSLAPFAAPELHAYVERRFASREIAARLAPVLEEPSGGNPLFVGALLSHLVAHGFVRRRGADWEMVADVAAGEIGLPDDLRDAIEAQSAKLPPDERVLLEAASVVGAEFSVDAVAAALEHAEDDVEDRCHELVALGQLRHATEALPRRDPRRAARYRFPHALHRHVLYDRLAPSRRRELHRRIGEHFERLYAGHAGEIAARLAMHFEAAGDVERTVRWLEQAGWNASLRHAYGEAGGCFLAAIANLRRLPTSRETRQQEAHLHLATGNAFVIKDGYTHARVVEAYAEAESVARASGAHYTRFRALIGLGSSELGAGNPRGAQPHADAMAAMAAAEVPELAPQAHWRSAALHLERGAFATASSLFERAMQATAVPGIPGAVDLQSDLGCLLGITLTHLGRLDQARASIQGAIRHADEAELPFSYAHTRGLAAEHCLLLRDAGGVLAVSDQMVDWLEQYAFPTARALQQFYRHWAMHQQSPSLDRVRGMHEALREKQALGEKARASIHLAELADAYRRCGELGSARECLATAFEHVAKTDERRHEAELHRIEGELLVAERGSSRRREEAEASFERAIEIAQRQGAKLWELRASVSLVRSLGRRATSTAARERLARVYAEFTEGLEAPDLQSARTLLADAR